MLELKNLKRIKMKNVAQLILLFGITLPAFSQQDNYYVNAAHGRGYSFWGSSNSYRIHMGNTNEYHYGPVTDYSIKTNMSATTGRGWTWGTGGLTPVAGLSNTGQFQIAGSFVSLGNLGIGVVNPQFRLSIPDLNENISIGNNVFINGEGSTGRITNNAYRDNGWQIHDVSSKAVTIEMRDSGAIEMYGTKTNGIADWQKMFGLDAPNNTVYFPSGNVGVGTVTPAAKLDILAPAISGSEKILQLKVSDASADYLEFANSTAGGGMYIPNIKGYHTTDNRQALSVVAEIGSSNDTGSEPVMIFDSRVSGVAVTWRPLFAWASYGNRKMTLTSEGNLGIGTTTPDEKLTVKGKIHTEEVRVDLSVPAPDYVFADNYNLPTLESIEKFIKSEKHLPEIPSAKEMEANGVELGTMNMLLLKKIEELTLYQIELLKKINSQNERITRLENN